jgi:hypothetical protein
VLVTLAAAIASSTTAPSSMAPSLWFQSLTVVRYNPLGLLEYARAIYRAPIYSSESAMFRTNFAGVGVDAWASPAFVRGGLVMELQPLSILLLWAGIEGIAYFGTFDFLQSFPGATSSWSDSDFDERAELSYATTGSEITFGATLQVKLGPIAARSIFRGSRPSYDLREGDTALYEPRFDILVPNDGWYINDDVDLLYVSDFGLIAGVRWTFAKAFFEEPDPNPLTHRIGPFLAYRFYSDPRGSTMFNEPTIILIANWWIRHRYRTGEDESQAIPYLVLGFLFNGETLFE